MLKPEYLESLPDAYVGLYAQSCEDILSDMARKINSYDYYCSAAQWQKQKLQELGMMESQINMRLSQLTNRSVSTLNQMFSDAATEALNADDAIHAAAGKVVTSFAKSEALLKVLNAGAKATQNTMKNLCGTTAHTATKQFEDALDRAWMQVSSGAFSYDAAVKTAIKDLCKSGVGYIKYPSGHTDTVEVAVRRAVVTGINQTACRLQIARADEMGCDLVETTAHAGARPSHVVWQGQVFSRSGNSEKYDSFESATGYGTGAGLGGWNCRHSFFPYYDGMARAYTPEMLKQYEEKKYTYNGKKLTEYEANQKQRYIERQTRRWKREQAAMKAGGQDTGEASAKVKQWQDTYKDFLNQTGLKRQDGRLVFSTANGVAKPSDAKMYQMFQDMRKYRTTIGEFDLKQAKEDYNKFLQSVPEKNRIYLEQSHQAVTYKVQEIPSDAPLGYAPISDTLYMDPYKQDFWRYDFAVSVTHELSHRIDEMFVQVSDYKQFSKAIAEAKQIIDKDPQKFIGFCEQNDKLGYLSDVIDGICDSKYSLPAGHGAQYWSVIGNKEKEIFANLFSIESLQDNDCLEFFTENFKEIMQEFYGMI